MEAELKAFLGVEKVIWLPRGLTKDYERYGTRGHVDIVAAFVRPGVVVAHAQPDPSHPDFEVCQENLGDPAIERPTPAAASWRSSRSRPRRSPTPTVTSSTGRTSTTTSATAR